MQCSRCKKPMKLQKIDRNLPANVGLCLSFCRRMVTSYFLNPQDVMKSALKSVMPIVQFQENQCRLLNKRIAETVSRLHH
ncbi:unnamed protein product [Toxocara canis]|uniref:Uncharacterized protein n=1 Tax=Toxocara canis TaxID=6265 RepID=A0A3P7FJU0_TOXCA|nr:unnamed protein product [Toxocara canis]